MPTSDDHPSSGWGSGAEDPRLENQGVHERATGDDSAGGGASDEIRWARHEDAGTPAPYAQPATGDPGTLGGHLSPWVILVWSTRAVGALVVIAFLNPSFLPFLAVITALSIGGSALSWWRFTWRLDRDALVIDQGLLSRQHRVIPLQRVQSVDTVRGIVHRATGVVQVKIEAIGGGTTEGQLDALDRRTADALASEVLRRRDRARAEDDAEEPGDDEPGAPEAGDTLVAITPRRLLASGFTAANVTVPAAILGLGWQAVQFRMDEGRIISAIVENVPGAEVLPGPLLALVLALAAVPVVLALFALGQLVTYWGFTLTRTDSELRVRRGLIEQRTSTVPLHRLQVTRVEQNPLRQLIGWATVRGDVAGRAGEGSGGTDVLNPFERIATALDLACGAVDAPDPGDLTLQRAPRRARTKRWIRAVLGTAAVAAPALVIGGAAWWPVVLIAVPLLGLAEASYRALGWVRWGPDHLVIRYGALTRRTVVLPRNRLQSLSLSQTVFQRWRRLANVDCEFARPAAIWAGARILDIELDDARELMAELADEVATPVVAVRAHAAVRPARGPTDPAAREPIADH